MKTKNTGNKFGILALGALLAAANSACELMPQKSLVESRSSAVSGNAGPSGPELNGVAAIRTFSQINESMAAVTGVDPLTAEIVTFQNQARTRLSLDGNIEGVSPAMLLAVSGLAGTYCKNLVTRERGIADVNTRLVFKSVDFTKDQNSLTEPVRRAVIQRYGERFWRRAPNEEETAILLAAFTEILAGRPNSTTEAQNALIATCTAALNSLDFIKS